MSFPNIPKIWSENDSEHITLENYLKYYNDDEHNFKKFVYCYRPINKTIDLNELKRFSVFLHSIPVDKNDVNVLPIIVDLDKVNFSDKLIYIIFETLIIYIISEKHWMVSITGECEPENCSNAVCYSSLKSGNFPLHIINEPSFDDKLKEKNINRLKKYKYNRVKNHEIALSRFCVSTKHLDGLTTENKSSYTSDIYEFLNESRNIIEQYGGNCAEIANTIFEIIDNCVEHTSSQYIYDIDIKKVIHGDKSSLCGKEYVAINIAIWDFSNVGLGDAIKRRVERIEGDISEEEFLMEVGEKSKIFKKLLEIKKTHEPFWSEPNEYHQDAFFALSAFQPGVTGRLNPDLTGGAGLAHVLDFLLELPNKYRCYCLTGCTQIKLDNIYLNKDEEGWYSFNENPLLKFTDNKPSEKCILKSDFFYPGTAFFLHLELNGGNYER